MFKPATFLVTLFLLSTVQDIRGDDFPNAEIIRVARGTVTFKAEGKQRSLPVALSLKLFNDQGEQQDVILGTARYLLPGNIVNITTRAVRSNPAARTDSKTKSKSKTDSKTRTKASDSEEITEIRFVSGKLGELPKTPDNVDLRPSPNWKGQVFGGEGYSSDLYWQKYIATATVGDFVEYTRGSKREPARIETVEVGKDYVIIHKVFFVLGTRQEQREKHRLPRPGEASAAPSKKPVRDKETLVINGQKIVCEVEKKGGKGYKWRSTDVPYDGLVKDDADYTLTNFGRGR